MGAWKNHLRFHKLSPYHQCEDNYNLTCRTLVGLRVTVPESAPVCQWSPRTHCADRPWRTRARVFGTIHCHYAHYEEMSLAYLDTVSSRQSGLSLPCVREGCGAARRTRGAAQE